MGENIQRDINIYPTITQIHSSNVDPKLAKNINYLKVQNKKVIHKTKCEGFFRFCLLTGVFMLLYGTANKISSHNHMRQNLSELVANNLVHFTNYMKVNTILLPFKEDVIVHMLVNETNLAKTDDFVTVLEGFLDAYHMVKVHVFLLLNDISLSKLNQSANNALLNKTRFTASKLHLNYFNVKVTILRLSSYFKNSSLRETWYLLNYDLLSFAARALALDNWDGIFINANAVNHILSSKQSEVKSLFGMLIKSNHHSRIKPNVNYLPNDDVHIENLNVKGRNVTINYQRNKRSNSKERSKINSTKLRNMGDKKIFNKYLIADHEASPFDVRKKSFGALYKKTIFDSLADIKLYFMFKMGSRSSMNLTFMRIGNFFDSPKQADIILKRNGDIIVSNIAGHSIFNSILNITTIHGSEYGIQIVDVINTAIDHFCQTNVEVCKNIVIF